MKNLSLLFTLSFLVGFLQTRAFTLVQSRRQGRTSSRLWADESSSSSSSSFDMEELKRRIADEANPFRGMFQEQQTTKTTPPSTGSSVREVLYIIAFGGKGVHSVEYPKGSGCNIILAFESPTACDEFAERLRAQQFFDPQPQAILTDTLTAFCDKMGVHMQIVPDGVDLIPPSQNVKLVGRHNRSLREQQRHIEYIFSMMSSFDEEESGIMAADAFQ